MECRIPEEKSFSTKNEIAKQMLNQALDRGLFQVQWVGCDAAYGNDPAFLDGLTLPEGIWYFAATNAKEQVFVEYPEQTFPKTKRGRPRKHPVLSHAPTSVQDIAQVLDNPWETIVLAEGAKGPIVAERKVIRCFSCRKDGSRNYVKPGGEIWLYLRKYADGEIKYFTSNAPATLSVEELDRAATLRWPIEQCFQECKTNLGMDHYECRSYPGWNRHMLFVMITHLFAIQIREIFKKKLIPLTIPMVVKLMHEIVTYAVTNMKVIVFYHIRRNHCAYLSHRKTMLLKGRCSTRSEWSVESMHWLLDVHFGEDFCRVEDLAVQQNLNVTRKIALNLIKLFKQRTASKRAISKIMFDCLLNCNT
jgi:hypothetical protein